MKQMSEKGLNAAMILMVLVYFISYATRLNYNTILVEIIDATGFSKAAASLPITGMAITYGAGQLISGFVGDQLQPKHLVGLGLTAIIFMNVLLPFCGTSMQMAIVWSINGLAQAFMWPPLVKLMNELFDQEGYSRACIAITCGGHLGHITLYLIAPVLIKFGTWKLVFYSAATAAVIILAVWMMKCPRIAMERKGGRGDAFKKGSFPWSGMLIAILVAIILMGSLRDGVTAWMPSLIAETFHFGNNISILTGVILPVFAIVSITIVSEIRRRWVRNELKLAAILFAICTLSAAMIGVFGKTSPIFTVILLGLLVSCMNGVNLLLISFVPRYYSKTGLVSFISGVLNSCTYIGAALSTYTIAVVSESFGWTVTIFLWSVIALFGGLLCAFQVQQWKLLCE